MDAKRLRAILRNYSHVRGAVRGRRNYQNAHTFTRNRNAKWTWATTAKHESARSLAKACQLASLLRRDNLRPNPLHLGCDGPSAILREVDGGLPFVFQAGPALLCGEQLVGARVYLEHVGADEAGQAAELLSRRPAIAGADERDPPDLHVDPRRQHEASCAELPWHNGVAAVQGALGEPSSDAAGQHVLLQALLLLSHLLLVHLHAL
mmetsp:Transcript_113371/g.315320  ORF Transcript_113371/g.315320 Transcript_113371/m.315320 type:complete len:207 (+) Transcript_113371:72-692(+)